MLEFSVHVVSGNYFLPGQVGQGWTAHSCPWAPPSTIRGFLEALARVNRDRWKGQFSYGIEQKPQGKGVHARQRQMLASRSIGVIMNGKGSKNYFDMRACMEETLYDIVYAIRVKSKYENEIKDTLDGKNEYMGCLSLGTSDNLVNWVDYREAKKDTLWVTKGKGVALIVQHPMSYSDLNPKYGWYDLVQDEARANWFTDMSG